MFIILSQVLYAQKPEPINTLHAPFLHGVASGDPTESAVIIWTRLSIPLAPAQVELHWEMASDPDFRNIVQSGTCISTAQRDYTVKVDVQNLNADSWYYYRFRYNASYSPAGRTRTMPGKNSQRLRFAVLSCQDYQNGFYNVLEDLTLKNNVDLVFFLGDYIYEYAAADPEKRPHHPRNEIVSLNDYRLRYSQYRLDPLLAEVHRQFPFICVWDDHETANDAYKDGAQNHSETEGDFYARKANARQVYLEWLPLRENNGLDQIYRSFHWGDLAHFYFLDTRLAGRDEQIGKLFPALNYPALNDSSRSLLGKEQWQWLEREIAGSRATWNLFAQQVMMAPLLYNIFESFKVMNTDQWDGYPLDRRKLQNLWAKYQTPNPIILTGDIHTSWANEIPNALQPNAAPVAVEFVGASVTSSNAMNIPGIRNEIRYMNPHIKFLDLQHHGYFVTDICPDSVQTDFYFVNTIESTIYNSYRASGFSVRNGSATLHAVKGEKDTQGYNPPLIQPISPERKWEKNVQILHISGPDNLKKPNLWLYADKQYIVEVELFSRENQRLYQDFIRVLPGFNEVYLNGFEDLNYVNKVQVKMQGSPEKTADVMYILK